MAIEMTVKQKEKERVQIDFTHDQIQSLDELKVKIEAATRAETVRKALELCEGLVDVNPDSTIKIFDKVRKALELYELFVNGVDPDSTVQILDKNNEVIYKFPTKLIKR